MLKTYDRRCIAFHPNYRHIHRYRYTKQQLIGICHSGIESDSILPHFCLVGTPFCIETPVRHCHRYSRRWSYKTRAPEHTFRQDI